MSLLQRLLPSSLVPTPMSPDTDRPELDQVELTIAAALHARLAKARKDALIFSVGVVVLTPFAMAAMLAALLFIVRVPTRRMDVNSMTTGDMTWMLLAVGEFVLGLFLIVTAVEAATHGKGRSSRPGDRSPWIWIGMAAMILAAIIGLHLGTNLVFDQPTALFATVAILLVAFLGFLGRAHAIDKQNGHEDVGHPAIGMAMVFAGFILDAYGEIFGSGWLLRGLADHEVAHAARALRALRFEDDDGDAGHDILCETGGGRIRMALEHLELIRRGPKLTIDGGRFVGEALSGG